MFRIKNHSDSFLWYRQHGADERFSNPLHPGCTNVVGWELPKRRRELMVAASLFNDTKKRWVKFDMEKVGMRPKLLRRSRLQVTLAVEGNTRTLHIYSSALADSNLDPNPTVLGPATLSVNLTLESLDFSLFDRSHLETLHVSVSGVEVGLVQHGRRGLVTECRVNGAQVDNFTHQALLPVTFFHSPSLIWRKLFNSASTYMASDPAKDAAVRRAALEAERSTGSLLSSSSLPLVSLRVRLRYHPHVLFISSLKLTVSPDWLQLWLDEPVVRAVLQLLVDVSENLNSELGRGVDSSNAVAEHLCSMAELLTACSEQQLMRRSYIYFERPPSLPVLRLAAFYESLAGAREKAVHVDMRSHGTRAGGGAGGDGAEPPPQSTMPSTLVADTLATLEYVPPLLPGPLQMLLAPPVLGDPLLTTSILGRRLAAHYLVQVRSNILGKIIKNKVSGKSGRSTVRPAIQPVRMALHQ